MATDIHQSGFGVRKLANGRLRVSSTNTATAKEKYDTRSVKAVDSFENIGPHTLPISFGSTLIKASPCVAAASGMDMTINWESTTSISKPRENNYSFVPPAAAKYFLWDNTPLNTACTIRVSEQRIHTIRLHAPAFRAMKDAMLKQISANPSLESANPSLLLGFFIGRIASSSMTALEVSKNQEESKVPTVLSSRRLLILDRFDFGRRTFGSTDSTSISPTYVREGDVVIKVVLMSESDFSVNDLEDLIQGIQANLDPFSPFPLCMGYRETGIQSQMSAIQLTPAINLSLFGINPIRLVPARMSHELLNNTDGESMSFGYVTIDQARHILPLESTDPVLHMLPLIGIWVKNVPEPTDSAIQTLLSKYILDKSLCKLETGKSVLLLVLFNAVGTSRLKKYRPDFFEVTFEVENEIYAVNQSSSRIATGDSLDSTSLGISCISDLEPVSFHCVPGFQAALKAKHNIVLHETAIIQSPQLSETDSEISPHSHASVSENPSNENIAAKLPPESTPLEHASSKNDLATPPSPTETSNNNLQSSQQPLYNPDSLSVQQNAYLSMLQLQISYLQSLSSRPGNTDHQNHLNPLFNSTAAFFGIHPFAALINMNTPLSAPQMSPGHTTASVNFPPPNSTPTVSVGTNTSFVCWESAQTASHYSGRFISQCVSTSPQCQAVNEVSLDRRPLSAENPSTLGEEIRRSSLESVILKRGAHGLSASEFDPLQDLPADTGSNYKPLYTYESIPTFQPEPSSYLKAGHKGLSDLASSHDKNTVSAAGERVCSQLDIDKPEAEAERGTPSLSQEADCFDRSSAALHQPLQRMMFSCVNKKQDVDDLEHLDLSKICRSTTGTTLDSLTYGYKHAALDSGVINLRENSVIDAVKPDVEENAAGKDVAEHTRELIARLVDDPEASFIFLEDKVQSLEKNLCTNKSLLTLDALDSALPLHDGQPCLPDNDFENLSESFAIAVADVDDGASKNRNLHDVSYSATREQYSEAMMSYLRRHGLDKSAEMASFVSKCC